MEINGSCISSDLQPKLSWSPEMSKKAAVVDCT